MFLWYAFLIALLTLSAALPGPTRVTDCQQDSMGVSSTRVADETKDGRGTDHAHLPTDVYNRL